MDGPYIESFNASTVQEAGEWIFKNIIKSKVGRKVIYYNGWDGYRASVVLRYVASMIPSRRAIPELCFGRTIFIDCSKWKNRREVQRAIAKELKLDRSVMDILDKQDEEDDFGGVDESDMNEIDSVAQVIDQTLSATKFVMFFINGSDKEIDVSALGIPVTRFGKNIVIWTFDRSSLTIMFEKIFELMRKLNYTHIIWNCCESISEFESSNLCGLLHQQATTIVARCPGMQDIDPTMVTECRLYGLLLLYNFHLATNLDWISHASNYWICDAIIKGDRAWDISKELHGEISWECDASLIDEMVKKLISHLEPRFLVLEDGDVYKEGPYRWISVTSSNIDVHGMQTIPAEASSFFLAFKRSNQQMGSGPFRQERKKRMRSHYTDKEIEEIEERTELFKKHFRSATTDNPSTGIPNGLFENSNNLGVLVLCSCPFNFASPPFRKCHNLRFLGLDRCTHKIGEDDNNDHAEWAWLSNLLVLDLRYTYWDEILSEEKMDLMKNIIELNIEGVRCWKSTNQLQGRLPNLQRLRIIRPTCPWEMSKDGDDSFVDKTSMEILDLSGNPYMKVLPTSLSKASSLRVLILDGCDGLEDIGRLPPSLRSFSFDGYGPASQRTPTVELPLEHFRPSTVEDNKNISTSKISLEGCTELDNLFLRGLNNLVELDLSGTAIKKFEFNTTVVKVPRLKRLYLIGCERLRCINFLPGEPDLELLCVDTRGGIVCPRPAIDKTKSFRLQVYAILVDARIIYPFGSLSCYLLSRHRNQQDVSYSIHFTNSPTCDWNEKFDHCDQRSSQQLKPAGQYSDVLGMVGDPPMQAFPQPLATRSDRHIEIGEGSCYGEHGLAGTPFATMESCIESMYLHDVSIHSSTFHNEDYE